MLGWSDPIYGIIGL